MNRTLESLLKIAIGLVLLALVLVALDVKFQ